MDKGKPENLRASSEVNLSKNSDDPRHGLKSGKNIAIFWIMTLLVALGFGVVMVSKDSAFRQSLIEQAGGIKDELPKITQVGGFNLTDQTGSAVGLDDLKGKVWIMNLMFTTCHGPCPLMSHHMSKMQRVFKSDDAVRFVSITVDPETDTPEKLAEYGKSFSAIPGKWFFLTGKKQEIIDFAVKSMKLPAGENPNLHSTRFVLVDQKGAVRGYYDSQERSQMELLKANIKQLVQRPSA